MDELTKIERTHEMRTGMSTVLDVVRELVWDVTISNTSPGAGWEPFAARKSGIVWRRPRLAE